MAKASHGGYDVTRFRSLADIEDRHFWFRARRTLIRCLTRRITSRLPAGFRVLELGCGSGNMLGALEIGCARGTVIGMDLFYEGLGLARMRGHRNLVQADAAAPPFSEAFHLIGIFDVIEHVSNDVDALRQIFHLLRPDGYLLVTVPAYPGLWSEFDDLSHHCRRYTEAELREKLINAGFEIGKLTPYMATTLPLVWLHRKLLQNPNRQSGGRRADDLIESEIRIVPFVNGVLAAFLWLESQFVAWGGRLAFGTSLFAIARKRESDSV